MNECLYALLGEMLLQAVAPGTEHREEMMDSRNPKLGLVDMRKIKGNILLRVWPLSKFGKVK